MRLQTASLLLLMSILWVQYAVAQYVQTNPLEWMALAEGNEAINGEIESQTDGQLRTAALQNTIAAEFNKIHEWERKYSSYLQTASGYASSLKAATTLYEDGVRIFISLGRLRKAVRHRHVVDEQPVYRDRHGTGDGLYAAAECRSHRRAAEYADRCGTE